jgi:pyruvate/2-oxoglutarate dehydrogenase complex dihydrolipoamide acyltransferase (E2) component
MSTEVLLPRLGFAMEEGNLVEWLAEDGATVTAGTPLFVLETEKASEEVESPASGTLRIKAAPANTYPVGTQLAVIED